MQLFLAYHIEIIYLCICFYILLLYMIGFIIYEPPCLRLHFKRVDRISKHGTRDELHWETKILGGILYFGFTLYFYYFGDRK